MPRRFDIVRRIQPPALFGELQWINQLEKYLHGSRNESSKLKKPRSSDGQKI